jgi:hypothetical protein
MLFQRRMIIAFLSFFVLNITLYVSMYLYLLIFEGTQLDLVKVTKMEKFEWMNIFYVCINMTFMTFIMIWTIISTRRNLQANFYYNHINSEFDNGLNFLKLRTIDIEVKRYETDVTSHKLTGVIKQELRQAGLDATVNATILMPDQSRLFELERERAELVTSFNILSKQKPYWKCVIPNELMVASEYRKKLDMLDFQIDQELMKPIKPSMTAFMSLNSLKAISHLKNKFK